MVALPTSEENAVILKTLLQAGALARQGAQQAFEVYEKGREDYVTTVDHALDHFLAQAFAQQFPQEGIITEENQASIQCFRQAHGRLWLIDPIDGTEDFINGGDHYSIMVGLLENYRPQAGWIYAPALGHCYWGGPGWGLFQSTEPGATQPLIPRALSLEDSRVMLLGDRDQRRFGAAIAQQLPDLDFNTVGSFGLKVLEVIKGQAGLYVYLNGRVKLWDTTGPLALAIAAGLRCCDLDGRPLTFAPTSIFPDSLIHRQPIIVGWPNYVHAYLPALRAAVLQVRTQELRLGAP